MNDIYKYNASETDKIIRNKMEILLTCDGLGKKVKRDALFEIIRLSKLEILINTAKGFDQAAFYGDDAESGKIGIALGKYIESLDWNKI